MEWEQDPGWTSSDHCGVGWGHFPALDLGGQAPSGRLSPPASFGSATPALLQNSQLRRMFLSTGDCSWVLHPGLRPQAFFVLRQV